MDIQDFDTVLIWKTVSETTKNNGISALESKNYIKWCSIVKSVKTETSKYENTTLKGNFS